MKLPRFTFRSGDPFCAYWAGKYVAWAQAELQLAAHARAALEDHAAKRALKNARYYAGKARVELKPFLKVTP